jgi:hypothetical protein
LTELGKGKHEKLGLLYERVLQFGRRYLDEIRPTFSRVDEELSRDSGKEFKRVASELKFLL